MWIGLCTLPLFLLVTGVRSYDRAQIDECFEKKIYRECVKEYGQWKHLPRATLVDFISASTDTQHALYQPPIAKISHWKNLAIVALNPAFRKLAWAAPEFQLPRSPLVAVGRLVGSTIKPVLINMTQITNQAPSEHSGHKKKTC
ncbi:hypothetical protein PSHT_14296 [Puccinia striiformis]|uniref:Uncharacterized protein n=1 Tax=Puccinia striiformis TaxID=27350 RepID=A0A2S4UL80_9BASI|nr:hypothetical protein PSHT_14296 [Puccinia striiformis]